MQERKFYIIQVRDEYTEPRAITESELKRRLAKISGMSHKEFLDKNCEPALQILLHGEALEDYSTKAKEPERKEGHSRLVYDKATRSIKKESGEPTCLSISEDLPTEKEPPTDKWEEWFNKQPIVSNYASLAAWAGDTQQWFREMPR